MLGLWGVEGFGFTMVYGLGLDQDLGTKALEFRDLVLGFGIIVPLK